MIPGQYIALLFFPGVVVHEIAHQLFCRFFRVAVLDVCYFRLGNPVGYVEHEPPRKTSHTIFIAAGPFLINSVIGALIAGPAAIPVLKFGSGSPLDLFLIWLGVSIAMHAFPSTGDAQIIWQEISSSKVSFPVFVLVMPMVLLIYFGALGSIFWLDLMYGIVIAALLPHLLILVLA